MNHSQSENKPPLDAKTLERINRLSCQQIEGLEPKHIKVLTRDFNERYVRHVISKGTTPSDQRRLLDAIVKGFRQLNLDYDTFGNEYLTCEPPAYLEDLDSALAFGELVTPEADLLPPGDVPIQPAMSIQELLDEEGMLKHWMSMTMNQLSATVNKAVGSAQSISAEIKKMRDGSITRLLKQVEATEERCQLLQDANQRLQGENRRLQTWYDDWQRMRRQVVGELYDERDVAEAGGMDDPSAMTIVIDAIMNVYGLQKENEELHAKQEAWRESEEYKAERSKWEKKSAQSIHVNDIKERLLRYAETYSSNESERLRYLVQSLNEILRATAWEQVAPSILSEVMANVSAKEKTEIKPEKMIVGTLKADAVNDIHHNENVKLADDGGKG